MFTINLEDGREAPSKARKKGAKRLEFLVYYIRTRSVLTLKKPFVFICIHDELQFLRCAGKV